ncbi:hypothetical protein M409DRAFT_68534 [Zasmidium cellare ATCC 36951]|uniref:Major facilitator superfamily (MFS) profile domain-containing protein n=1 Tax=Zasmidium cellare ATCC 36951 TaxID=1080233 RepID=A0A6A6CAF6_ZASCE|nr:uncharacterized protein M409DRAFT_68534 [Zasmidium cellare ATCC 36951]KAF2163218.1 hypothetical protein M409DRAFT_68534 [Zasmidium cellare ATCC 36951]
MTLGEAFRSHRPAMLWAMAISLQGIMEGYNIALVGALVAAPAFQRRYGDYYDPELGYQVSFRWQMAFMLGAAAGGIVGGLLSGYMIEKIGARITIMTAHVVLCGTIAITFCAPSIQVLFVGCLCNGLPWGILAGVGPVYASEVCPTAVRGYLINFVNFAWSCGGLLAAGVLQPFSTVMSQWAYRIPFAIQWIWPVPLFLIAFFAPSSPWWLIRRGRIEETRKSLRSLTRGLSDKEIDAKIALMKHTDEYEKMAKTESSFADCFKGTNLPRTEIAAVVLTSQAITGQVLAASPTIGAGALGVAGNIFCWFLMAWFGRRRLFLFGLAGCGASLMIVGILDSFGGRAIPFVQAALCLVWMAIYSSIVAPGSYTIAGEISATRVRSQTMGFSRAVFGILSVTAGVVQTYITNPTGANISGKAAYVWFGGSTILFIWAFFRLPETKGRTYEELDILFETGVTARKFRKQHIEVVAENNHKIVDDADP